MHDCRRALADCARAKEETNMKQDLLTEIQERMSSMSKGQRAIGHYIVHNYDKAAFMTAAKLGTTVGVSESTVVRFAIAIGYEGYPELQDSLRELIRNKLTAVQRIEITNDRLGDGDILDQVLSSDIDKIKHTIESVNRESFDRAVDQILGARRIYIIGMRSSSVLSNLLYYYFRMIFANVTLVQTTSGSEIFEQLLHIGPEDVVFAASFPRYSRRIVNAVDYAHNQGAKIVALTDSALSPIALHADSLLLAQSDMASFVDSLVAPMSLINALIVAIAKKKQTEIGDVFARLESIWDEYEVYDKEGGR